MAIVWKAAVLLSVLCSLTQAVTQSSVHAGCWRAAVSWIYQSNEEKDGPRGTADVGPLLNCIESRLLIQSGPEK